MQQCQSSNSPNSQIYEFKIENYATVSASNYILILIGNAAQ